jgi:hypothetical protein
MNAKQRRKAHRLAERIAAKARPVEGPGHFIGADRCHIHIHHHIGPFCVSTVGDYRPQGGAQVKIGADRTHETMIFDTRSGSRRWTERRMCPANSDARARVTHLAAGLLAAYAVAVSRVTGRRIGAIWSMPARPKWITGPTRPFAAFAPTGPRRWALGWAPAGQEYPAEIYGHIPSPLPDLADYSLFQALGFRVPDAPHRVSRIVRTGPEC